MMKRIVPFAFVMFALAGSCGQTPPGGQATTGRGGSASGGNGAGGGDTGSAGDGGGGAAAGGGGPALCTLWPDADGDGFGAKGDPVSVPCDSVGYAASGDDCDDGAAQIHPGAFEVAADGIDQDCDSFELCYTDADSDGYRPASAATTLSSALGCNGPGVAGASAAIGDCLDSNPDVFPGQTTFFKKDRGDGSFDYNCDYIEEKEHTSLHTCYTATTQSGCMAAKPGWGSGVPGCGSYGDYGTCVWSASYGCLFNKDAVIQNCR